MPDEQVLEVGGGMGTDLAQFASNGAIVTDVVGLVEVGENRTAVRKTFHSQDYMLSRVIVLSSPHR